MSHAAGLGGGAGSLEGKLFDRGGHVGRAAHGGEGERAVAFAGEVERGQGVGAVADEDFDTAAVGEDCEVLAGGPRGGAVAAAGAVIVAVDDVDSEGLGVQDDPGRSAPGAGERQFDLFASRGLEQGRCVQVGVYGDFGGAEGPALVVSLACNVQVAVARGPNRAEVAGKGWRRGRGRR